MKKRRILLLGFALLGLVLLPSGVMVISWDAAPVGAAYAVGGTAALGLGWVFLWGTLDEGRIREQFGDRENLVRGLALPAVPAPSVPQVRGIHQGQVMNLAALVPEEIRLPPVDPAQAVAALPPVPPRSWRLKAGGDQAVDYVAMAQIDLEQELRAAQK